MYPKIIYPPLQTIIAKGNGKIKTKEPLQMANKAISQLKEVLDAVNSGS